MSAQATAGHGPDLLGLPIVIEGSPEALQTAAMLAISGTEADLDRGGEQTGTPDTVVVHPTSSVYGADAAGAAMVSHSGTATRVDAAAPSLAQARDRDTTTTLELDFTDPSHEHI